MTSEQFTKGRTEFIKACSKARREDLSAAVYDLDMICDGLLQQNAHLCDEILSLKSVISAAIDELRSNGREMPHKMALELAALARKDADALGKESHANLQIAINLGAIANRKAQAKDAINTRHDKEGGSRDLKTKLRDIWATGKYLYRTTCADKEYRELGIKTYGTAYGYLEGTPDPDPWSAKEQERLAKQQAKGKRK